MKSRKIIAGVDEVGRGSLIGSVYSAAVILPTNGFSLELRDSKKLAEKSRIKIANSLIKESVCISVGIATKDEIDSINIHHATLLSMRRAVYNLVIEPDLVKSIDDAGRQQFIDKFGNITTKVPDDNYFLEGKGYKNFIKLMT